MTNRIAQHFQSDDDGKREAELEAWCEKTADELIRDSERVKRGEMSVEEYDAKY